MARTSYENAVKAVVKSESSHEGIDWKDSEGRGLGWRVETAEEDITCCPSLKDKCTFRMSAGTTSHCLILWWLYSCAPFSSHPSLTGIQPDFTEITQFLTYTAETTDKWAAVFFCLISLIEHKNFQLDWALQRLRLLNISPVVFS